MHWIERHVLKQLIQNPSLRYADIKPQNVEGSLFMYHLRTLKKDDYVTKSENNLYELTPKGKLFADKLQLESFKAYEQPRIVVLVACQDDKKGLLLFRRKTQPVIGMVGFPHVNIQLGTKLTEHAQDLFEQQSGLRIALERRGEGYITMYNGEEPESYIFFHLLSGRNPTGVLNPESETGTYFWQNQLDVSAPDVMPSMKDLLTLLNSSAQEPFFTEITTQLT